jgi:peptidoglycan/LPS O-acetylase OafA/YrhL
MTTTRQPALLQLTSLRFFAALAVLFSHLGFLQKTDNPLQPLALTVFHEGFSGVAFFFILSGFILSYTYQNKLRDGGIAPRHYFLLRLARIYPLHFLTALPFAALAVVKGGAAISTIVPNFLLLQSWIPDSTYYFSLNAVSWSLSNEMFFYACFIWLAPLSTVAIRRMIVVMLAAIAGALALSVANGHGAWLAEGKLYLTHYLSYVNPAVRLLDFLVGIWIYRSYCGRSTVLRHATVHECAAVLLLLGGMYGFSHANLPDVLRSQILYLPLMAYVIAVFAQGAGALSRFIQRPLFVLLGEASFALYMLHQPIINLGYAVYTRLGLPAQPLLPAVLLMALSVAASIFTYKLIELPIHNYLRIRIARMFAAAPVPVREGVSVELR